MILFVVPYIIKGCPRVVEYQIWMWHLFYVTSGGDGRGWGF